MSNNSKIERTCPNCSKNYFASAVRLKYGRETTCSRECSYELRGKKLENKVDLKCEVCDNNFKRIPAKNVASIKVCSLSCYFAARKQGVVKNYPKPPKKETLTFTCETCKNEVVLPARFKGARVFRFCSVDCVGKSVRGDKNFFWRGGHANYYGENWKSQRRATLKRDNFTCQRCKKHKNELGKNPDVHHIIPFKQCGNYKTANALENLISLCHKCHSTVEWRGLDFSVSK